MDTGPEDWLASRTPRSLAFPPSRRSIA